MAPKLWDSGPLTGGSSPALAWALTEVVELSALWGQLCRPLTLELRIGGKGLWEAETTNLIHWALRNLAGQEEGAPGTGLAGPAYLPHPGARVRSLLIAPQ